MAEKKFDLGNYVEVKDRIRIFYELFGGGRLVTEEVTILTDPADKQRVMVKALAYRTPDDPHPGVGFSWMELPGTTSYTKGSELENTETSAWGRAIASLGILIDHSIASGQEVQNKQRPVGDYDEPPDRPELERTTHEDGLIGVANLGKNGGASTGTDYQLRQEREGGHVIGFRLTQGRKGYKVLAFDPLASVLATQNIIGERVTCWGTMHDESFRDDKTGRLITYQIMHLERIATPDMILPAAVGDTPVNPANPDEVSPLRVEGISASEALALKVGEYRDGDEAMPEPLPFEPLTEDEKAAIGGGLPG